MLMMIPQASPAPLIGCCLSSLLHDEGIQTQSVRNGCFFLLQERHGPRAIQARTHTFLCRAIPKIQRVSVGEMDGTCETGLLSPDTSDKETHLYNIQCWCSITQLELWLSPFSIFKLKTGPIPPCWVYPSLTNTGSARAECQHVI